MDPIAGLLSAWSVPLPCWLHGQRLYGGQERVFWWKCWHLLVSSVQITTVRVTWATDKALLSYHGSGGNQEFSIYSFFSFPAQFQPQETHPRSLRDVAVNSILQFKGGFGPRFPLPPPSLPCCVSLIRTHLADVVKHFFPSGLPAAAFLHLPPIHVTALNLFSGAGYVPPTNHCWRIPASWDTEPALFKKTLKNGLGS